MIYAIRQLGTRQTLIEAKSVKSLDEMTGPDDYTPVASWWARDWVKGGGENETGLWVDDGKVRYAWPERPHLAAITRMEREDERHQRPNRKNSRTSHRCNRNARHSPVG